MAAPGIGITGSRVGIGDNFAKARLLLAKRAGYMQNNQPINTANPQAQWKAVSSNLAADSRKAGFPNPMAFLRQGAQMGSLPQTKARPGGTVNPQGSLAYSPHVQAQQAPQQSTVHPMMAQLPELIGQTPPTPVPLAAGGGSQAALAARMAALQAALLPMGRGSVIS